MAATGIVVCRCAAVVRLDFNGLSIARSANEAAFLTAASVNARRSVVSSTMLDARTTPSPTAQYRLENFNAALIGMLERRSRRGSNGAPCSTDGQGMTYVSDPGVHRTLGASLRGGSREGNAHPWRM
jgi:hypothetical protein